MTKIVMISVSKPNSYIKPPLINGKAWVAALRSGEYKQGTDGDLGIRVYDFGPGGQPNGEHHFEWCCLGVYGKINGDLKLNEQGRRWVTAKGSNQFKLDSACRSHHVLNSVGEVRLEVYAHQVRTQYQKTEHMLKKYNSLAGLNDGGASFEMIACVIEQLYELL